MVSLNLFSFLHRDIRVFHLLLVMVVIASRTGSVNSILFEYPISEAAHVGKVIVDLAREFSINTRSRTQSLQITNSRSTEGAKYFAINSSTGELFVAESPDRDKLCEAREDCIIELMVAHGDNRNPEVTSVRIRLIDVNDNAPTFPEKVLELNIREETDPNLVFKTLPLAIDPDLGSNSVQTYVINEISEETSPFGVERKDNTLQLVVNRKLDRERKATYKFNVLAKDGGQPQRTGTLSVRVNVKDVNDHRPEFSRTSYSAIIQENTPEGITILNLEATDKDSGKNGMVSYRMAKPRDNEERLASQYFDVYSSDGEGKVVIKQMVDIDTKSNLFYRFKVIAFDHASDPLESQVPVIIRVRDVNDDKPRIKINYIKSDGSAKRSGLLMENEEKVFIALVTVTDRDSGPGGLVSCKVDNDMFYLQDIEGSPNRYKTGVKWQQKKYKLLTRQGVDRERMPHIQFALSCHDNAVGQKNVARLVSTEQVKLRVIDKNDEKPEFTEERYTFRLMENLARPDAQFQVGHVKAVDKDEGKNAKIVYSLEDSKNTAFTINRDNGVIYARQSFDRELTQFVDLKVRATDQGTPQQTATADVRVIITDVNDNAPVFKVSDYHFTVVENSRVHRVGRVQAEDEDKDKNAQIEYRIKFRAGMRKYFSINRHSGVIHLNSRLDRERQEQFVFHVIAVDKPTHNQRRKTGTATVTITVLDENDNPPRIQSPKNNEVKIIDDTEPIGKDLFTMRATDPDEGVNGSVVYHVIRGHEGFFMIDKSAGIFYVMRKLEGIQNKLFSVVLMASDQGRSVSLNSTVTVRIRVQSGEAGHLPPVDPGPEGAGDTGRTLIVVAATVLLLLVLAAVALLIMLRMRRTPNASRRANEESKRKWKDGFVGKVSETYVCSRSGPKGQPPRSNLSAEGDEEKADEYLLESTALRSKDMEANYNSLNFYKGDPVSDKLHNDHTYYEVAKSKDGSIDNYSPFEKDDDTNSRGDASLNLKKSPFLGDMRIPGPCHSEMTIIAGKRRQEKPFTPYIEASFV